MIVMALVVYLAAVGLDKADKVASSIGAVVALVALGAPYLLPRPQPGGVSMPDPDRVEESGKATATGGGRANTGLQAAGDGRPAQVTRSGDATAEGPGSVANTGIQRGPRP
ncbi:hypothetical protein [Micromonospora sp. A200]|uniref:hypothetical protein n=1 Tax=Micromonospora sp. A200 TaxID=2940568 RepID=UPI00247503FF|nr:hypothetical protein [Micromonospora sp. A200]